MTARAAILAAAVLGLAAAAILTLAAAAILAPTATAGAIPIPDVPGPVGLSTFIGAAAAQHPVAYPAPPRHPFMAPNGASNIHDDAYMSNTYQRPGPLGHGTAVRSVSASGLCGSVTFDTRGRIVSVCVSPVGPTLELLDPRTLSVTTTFALPKRNLLSGTNIFQDFSGGGYFYLDQHDQAVIPTTTRHVYVVAETGATPGFRLAHDYDLSHVLPSGDKITSVLPDWSGRLWFISFGGVVGTIDPADGAVHAIGTGEEIENSFSVDQTGGVYIVSNRAMYRYDAGRHGEPVVSWRQAYPNSRIHKPGQVDAGSGTTPTLMGADYVAITDNADPMDIVVYQRARRVAGSRLVCVQPVFGRGASATENSLIGTDHAMVVENNYGYNGPTATLAGRLTSPGIERVDINPGGRGCHPVWNNAARAPSVVPKLSLSAGLIYTYTKAAGGTDPWYLTALDFATGQTVYQQFAGTGVAFNNNYAPVSIGPDSSAYVGVLGGLVQFRDAFAPPFLKAAAPKPHLALAFRRRPDGRLRISLRGSGMRRISSVRYFLGSHALGTRRRAPYVLVAHVSRAQRHRLRAIVRLKHGRPVTLRG
jgi:hypothetical protein